MAKPIPIHSGPSRDDKFLPVNTKVDLTRDAEGFITEIKLTAETGDYFTRTISYDGDNNVISVSAWVATYV